MCDFSARAVAACGTGWRGAYLIFSVINGAEEGATQSQITAHNKILRLIKKEKWEEEKTNERMR